MAKDSTKYLLEQSYASNKAKHTNRKGLVRVKPYPTVWEKLGDFVEGHGMDPAYFMAQAFKLTKDASTLFPGVLLSKELLRDILSAFESEVEDSDIVADFESVRTQLLPYCIKLTGSADLGNPIFKRSLWGGTHDGIPPTIRVLCAYPEPPECSMDAKSPIVKSMIQDAYFEIKTRPDVETLLRRLGITRHDIMNWSVMHEVI